MDAPSQHDAIAFLSDPATHGGAKVERIDTHISTVFLAGDLAYKLKKAVRLPFLDFSTPDLRAAACAAELAINRRAAPELYLRVAALTREADGTLAFDGSGPVVDRVVVMRRFDQATLFDRLAEAGGLNANRIDDLTDTVAACHDRAPCRPDHGGADALAAVIASNHAAMLAQAPAILDPEAVAALTAATQGELALRAAVLERRRHDGRVRACHGDLHLGNICLVEDRPTLFDAIEFSDSFACIDVWYDFAFLLMDLCHRGLTPLASRAMNRYLDRTGDYEGVALLPLFLSLRAAVRAHVEATIAAGTENAVSKGHHADLARRHLAAARAYLSPPAARLVAVGGLSGSGKSRLAAALAPLLGLPGAAVVRSDAVRKRLMGVGPFDRLGPDGYRPDITERTYRTVVDLCAGLLAAGQPAIADAVFARPDERMAIAAAAGNHPFAGLWLDVVPAIAGERIGRRRHDISDATAEIRIRQQEIDTGPIAWTRIDSGGPRDDTLAAARATLGV